jgi:PhnB protein
MAANVNPIPEGYYTLTPYLAIKNAAEAINFYKKAFGAEEITRMPGPDGKTVMHAELQIGSSRLMLSEECPGMASSPKTLGGTPVTVHMYVPDVNATFDRAIQAGATAVMPPQDMFWGDRFGKVTDPYGHAWSIAQHVEDVAPEEMAKRAQAFNEEWAKKTEACKG